MVRLGSSNQRLHNPSPNPNDTDWWYDMLCWN